MGRLPYEQQARGERHGNARLTDEQAREILESDEPTVELARRFGVSIHTVFNVRAGRCWIHIHGERRTPEIRRARIRVFEGGVVRPKGAVPLETLGRPVSAQKFAGGGTPRYPDLLYVRASSILPQVLRDGEGIEVRVVHRNGGVDEEMLAWEKLEDYPRWTGRLDEPKLRTSSRTPRPSVDPLRGRS